MAGQMETPREYPRLPFWARIARAFRRPISRPKVEEGHRQDRSTERGVRKPSGHQPISLSIAGVMHEGRDRTARKLALGQRVWLAHELKNEFDSNAVAAETQSGECIGYIGKTVAAKLAPYIDTSGHALEATVTELTTDISAEMVGVAVSLFLPEELVSGLAAQRRSWEFDYDEAGAGAATYLFLNCDAQQLGRAMETLQERGLHLWSSLSYRPGPHGRQYRWYIRVEDAVSKDDLGRILRDTLGPTRSDDDYQEFAKVVDANAALQKQLEARVQEPKSDTPRSPPRRRPLSPSEIGELLAVLLPNLHFRRNSLEVMTDILQSYLPVLRKLRGLSTNPGGFKGEGVRSAPPWKEAYFNTGSGADGRLYFMEDTDGTYRVLVSRKDSQKRDIEYMKHDK